MFNDGRTNLQVSWVHGDTRRVALAHVKRTPCHWSSNVLLQEFHKQPWKNHCEDTRTAHLFHYLGGKPAMGVPLYLFKFPCGKTCHGPKHGWTEPTRFIIKPVLNINPSDSPFYHSPCDNYEALSSTKWSSITLMKSHHQPVTIPIHSQPHWLANTQGHLRLAAQLYTVRRLRAGSGGFNGVPQSCYVFECGLNGQSMSTLTLLLAIYVSIHR